MCSLLLALLLPAAVIAQPTVLKLDRSAGPARLWLDGEWGRDYTIEASDGNLDIWRFLATTPLTNGVQVWFDACSLRAPKRFYRAVKLDPSEPAPAANFRLIDHLGRSSELNYYLTDPAVSAIVLLFTGNGCAKVSEMLAPIRALTDRFAPEGVLFWMVDANSGDNRSNIVAEATALGITLPILHDRAQLVARTYQASGTPEAVVLKRAYFLNYGTDRWSVFYQGAIDDRLGSNAVATTQHYLSDALENLLNGAVAAPLRTVPNGCDITLNPPYPNLSYSADIAPLLQDKCVHCHSPGNIGSWTMTSYESVALYRDAIREEILTDRMPPWQADPRYGTFINDASLQPEEAAKLIQWIDAGAPRGTGPDPLTNVPASTNYPFAWPADLGPPTAIYSIPAQSIPAFGVIDYRYLNVTTTFSNDVWLRAAIIKPGNTRVVHHGLVFNGSSGSLQGLDGFFAGYVPGFEAAAFPAGTGKLLRRGEVLRFQMHYVSVGTPETDQTQLGLYVLPAPPTYSLQTKSAFNVFFSIPPGAKEQQASATFGPFSKAVNLYEFSPHMHLRGSWFKYEAIYPNNTREILGSVPSYQFNWQRLYRFAQPKLLPAGTRIVCTGAWDNSAQNPWNPDPTARVTFGEQTYDEMFIGYFNYAELP
jgi:hypothetical protein